MTAPDELERRRGSGLGAEHHAMADTSAPLLLRMGFVEVCRFVVYRG